jgi:hypothetical protein
LVSKLLSLTSILTIIAVFEETLVSQLVLELLSTVSSAGTFPSDKHVDTLLLLFFEIERFFLGDDDDVDEDGDETDILGLICNLGRLNDDIFNFSKNARCSRIT